MDHASARGRAATARGQQRRAHRVRTRLLAALLCVGVLPATQAAGLEDDPQLATAREQLQGASRALSGITVALRRTNDEVAALDDALRTATTELAQLEGDIAAARRAHDAAAAAHATAAERLAGADARLAAELDSWERQRERMTDRLVHTYKHGGADTADLWLRGVGGATDWHEVSVALEVFGRVTSDESRVVDSGLTSTRSTAQRRAAAGTARSEALTTAREAASEARQLEQLLARQQRLVADTDEQHRSRTAVLAALEQDMAARAVLVRQLEEQIARLERRASLVLVPVRVDLDVFGPPPAWASGLPNGGSGYGAAIEATAARHGIDGRLLAALVWTESGFRADAVSHAGALGLAQLMPATARGLGVDPRDPLQNLDGGARYLRTQLERFDRVDLALAAYNAGPGRVAAAGRVPDIVETQLYVVRVLDRYEALVGLSEQQR